MIHSVERTSVAARWCGLWVPDGLVRFVGSVILIVSFGWVSMASVAGTEFLDNGVTAHRGNSSEFPENTLPAFASGIAVGADWLELDIFRTADGKLIVIHDATTARVGDRDLDVAASTYAELAQVDVATGFREEHGLTFEACPRQTAPLLEEVLRLVMRQERTRVSIQPKMDCVAEALELIQQLEAQRWVGFNESDLALVTQVKRAAPEIPVFWDRGPSDVDRDIATAQKHGFETLVLFHETITAPKVSAIHAAGLQVGAWTVNDEDEMRRLLGLGVDRIYTDYPRQLLKLIEQ